MIKPNAHILLIPVLSVPAIVDQIKATMPRTKPQHIPRKNAVATSLDTSLQNWLGLTCPEYKQEEEEEGDDGDDDDDSGGEGEKKYDRGD